MLFAFFLQPLAFRRLHRCVSFLLLAVFAAGLTGLPITKPSPLIEARYPCENCGCGCPSVEFCWDKCCCHSDTEKLRWADDNGVTPPAFLVARVKGVTATVVGLVDSSAETCCGCGKTNRAATCDRSIAEDASRTDDAASQRICLVRLEDAAKCRGLQWLWSSFSSAIIDPVRVTGLPIEPHYLFSLLIHDDQADSRSDMPDTPVP
ncbi:hypothetical protein [Roseimaritima multifibrata]|uniref:hypothetical protein n=1 Tax=Roseimaritima multifibrata TaxID=1930274 RepID=UPI0011A00728|nr:hypothetical protein [Roseimaritima multifibrata]